MLPDSGAGTNSHDLQGYLETNMVTIVVGSNIKPPLSKRLIPKGLRPIFCSFFKFG